MDPFEPANLRLPTTDRPTVARSKKPPRHRAGERFLKGPIPWPWLEQAARLAGKALAVGLLLWLEAGCRKARTVPLCLRRGEQMGVNRQAVRRALRSLEVAGLVAVERNAGRCLAVTLLEAPDRNGACKSVSTM